MAIPALHRVLGEDTWPDLVTLDAGTADRPHVQEAFIDQAIAEAAAEMSDPDLRSRAAELGATLDDPAVFALATQIMAWPET
jgi:hypothetical protein